MASNGSFSGSIYGGHYSIRVDWSAAQDVANNRTTITCNLYFINDWSINIGVRNNSITIAGTTISLSSPAYNSIGTHHIGSCQKTIDHNPDGSLGNINLSAVFNIKATLGATYYASISASDTVNIDTIPRASQPSLSATTFTLGDSVWLYTNRKSSSFTHSLYLMQDEGVYYDPVATNITDGINLRDIETFDDIVYNKSSNSNQWPSNFLLRTYNGGQEVGDLRVNFTAIIPENESTKPTLKDMVVSSPPLVEWCETEFVQGKSKIVASMSAVPKLNASIQSYVVSVNGRVDSLPSSEQSAIIETAPAMISTGTITVTGKAIDTRGFPSNAISQDIYITPYNIPIITPHSQYGNIICSRYDEEKGEISDSGTSIKIVAGARWYSLSKRENSASVWYKCVSNDFDSGWQNLGYIEEKGGGAENGYISYFDIDMVIPNLAVAVDKTYSIYIRCTDRFGAYNTDCDVPFKIPTEDTCLHLGEGGNRAAFGKYAEEEKTLEIAPDWKFKLKGYEMWDFNTRCGEETVDGLGWNCKEYKSGDVECRAVVNMSSGCIDITAALGYAASCKYIKLPYKFDGIPNIALTSISTGDATNYGVISYSVRNYTSEGFNIQQNCSANTGNTWVSVIIVGRPKEES